MAKANEIVQWILIGLLIVYAVALPIVMYKIGMAGLGMFARGQYIKYTAEKAVEQAKKCETKADCGYGIAEISLNSKEGFGSLFDQEGLFSDVPMQGSMEGCFNIVRVDGFEEKDFNGECTCISGQCGWIR